jgi:EpsI family protein
MNTLAVPKFNLQHLLIGVFMLLAAGLAFVLTPKAKLADQGPRVDLESLIPKQFGDWRVDESIVPLQVSPDVQAKLDKIYNQTLARTYINSQGERIMLSIAYGSDQSDNMAVHKPEVCYPAQGFQLLKNPTVSELSTGEGFIPIKRLVAGHGQRIEPITYWTTVGGKVAVNSLKWKLQQLKYGLTGTIPDGLLFRISSIEIDESRAYSIQDKFARDLIKTLTPEARRRIIGNSLPAS